MTSLGFVRTVAVADVVATLLLVAAGWGLGGADTAIGAGAGGLVGLGNFLVASWLLRRLFEGPASTSKAALGLLLAGKFVVLVAVLFVLIRGFGLDGVGVALGYSALVLALLAGGLRYTVTPAAGQDGKGHEGS